MFVQEIYALIDRSASMLGKETDTIEGINKTFEILRQNKNSETKINISVKLFNHEELILFQSIDVENVKKIEYHEFISTGFTALLDAIGNTIKYLIERKNQYNNSIIYIMTDGYENSSKYFTYNEIKNLIKEAENYNIKLLYLGANQDAILEAKKYGIPYQQAMNYSENKTSINSALTACANFSKRMYSNNDVYFTDFERKSSFQYRSISSPPFIKKDINNSKNYNGYSLLKYILRNECQKSFFDKFILNRLK